MNLTPDQINEVTKLNLELSLIRSQVESIEQKIKLLLDTQNKLQVNISMQDLNYKDSVNIKENHVFGDPIWSPWTQFRGIQEFLMLGIDRDDIGKKQVDQSCHLSFQVTEKAAIIILNALRQEKLEHMQLIQEKLSEILIPVMRIDINNK